MAPASQHGLGIIVDAAPERPLASAEALRLYTQRRPATGARRLLLALAADLKRDEWEAISQAAGEWNHALNGHVAFYVGPLASSLPGGSRENWVVMKSNVRGPHSDRFETVALTMPAREGGLVMLLDRQLWRVDLKRIVLHELGHVLGLGHNEQSRLMSSRYFGDYQKCIDYASVQMVSELLRIPMQELNWCGPSPAGSHS